MKPETVEVIRSLLNSEYATAKKRRETAYRLYYERLTQLDQLRRDGYAKDQPPVILAERSAERDKHMTEQADVWFNRTEAALDDFESQQF